MNFRNLVLLALALVLAFHCGSDPATPNDDDDDTTNNQPNDSDTIVDCSVYELTVQSWLDSVNASAKDWSTDAQLISITGHNINTEGIADICDTSNPDKTAMPTWIYEYMSFFKDQNFQAIVRGQLIINANKNFYEAEVINDDFIDSDSLMSLYTSSVNVDSILSAHDASISIYLDVDDFMYDGRLIYTIDLVADDFYSTWIYDAVTGENLERVYR